MSSQEEDTNAIAGFVIIAFKAPVYILTVWALLKYVGCAS